MSLQIPGYVHDFNAAPEPEAYGFITTETANFTDMSGNFTVGVWEDRATYDAGKRQCDAINLRLGSIVREAAGETPAVRLATLEELLAEPEFGAAFDVIKDRLYEEAKKHSKLANAINVP
jgi:hypothetical protein